MSDPDIITWFSSLDQHPQRREKYGLTFAPYGPILRQKGFFHVSQLVSDYVKPSDVQEWLDVEVGVAILILDFAKADLHAS